MAKKQARANDFHDVPVTSGVTKGGAHSVTSRDDEIVALLKQVGDKLRSNEKERRSIKSNLGEQQVLVEDLENKSDQSEKIFLTLQDKINKIETAELRLRKQHEQIALAYKANLAKIEKSAALADRIEKALEQQSRLNRRLEKISHDRSDIMKKLEKIEGDVTHSQQSVNVQIKEIKADIQNQLPVRASGPEAMKLYDEHGPWWRSAYRRRSVSMAAIVALAVLAGWSINVLKAPSQTSGMTTAQVAPQVMPVNNNAQYAASDQNDSYQSYEDRTRSAFDRFAQDVNQDVGTAPRATAPTFPSAANTSAANTSADSNRAAPQTDAAFEEITTMGDQNLTVAHAQDTDALAAQLNDIRPSAGHLQPQDLNSNDMQATPPKAQEASFVTEKQPQAFDSKAFVAAQASRTPLSSRIQSDTSLPASIRELEVKAFEGIAEAQHDLGAVYTAGHGGASVNYDKAAVWFKEAAINGIPNARYNLGVLYHQGLGVEKDVDKAIGWYQAAADLGHAEAYYNLGIAYIEGIGTSYSPTLAAKHFEQAAENGIMEAAYNLGLIHENGLLGEPRPQEALYWYKVASVKGSQEAQTALEQLAERLDISMTEIDKIFKDIRAQTPIETKPKKSSSVEPRAPRRSQATNTTSATQPNAMKLTSANETASSQVSLKLISRIQEQLMTRGLYPGPPDGLEGPRTFDAIRSYQAANNLQSDGRASEALLLHMIATN